MQNKTKTSNTNQLTEIGFSSGRIYITSADVIWGGGYCFSSRLQYQENGRTCCAFHTHDM